MHCTERQSQVNQNQKRKRLESKKKKKLYIYISSVSLPVKGSVGLLLPLNGKINRREIFSMNST